MRVSLIVDEAVRRKRLDSAGGAVVGCAMRTSRAVVQTAPRRLELRELPVPEIDDDSALLRIEACGICGSDAEQYAGVLPVRLPVVPGHEPLGVIERIGDRAAKRWGVDVGDRVAVESIIRCGHCRACIGGRYQLCRGRASVVAARAAGADTIIVTGLSRDARKLALARELGADHVIDVEREDARARVRELTGGRGAEVVIEVTANAPEPVAEALHYVAAGGRIVLAGVKGLKAVPDFVSDLVVVKEITIRGAFAVTSRAYESAIRLIESGRVPLEKMHTHDFPLEDAERAIQTLAGELPGEASIHSCLVP